MGPVEVFEHRSEVFDNKLFPYLNFQCLVNQSQKIAGILITSGLGYQIMRVYIQD